MKKILALIAMMPAFAFASLGIEFVDQVDKAREGNLSAKVVAFYKANHFVVCGDGNEPTEITVMKLSSDSSNLEKKVGTP
jgi:hypothetical protein